MSDIMTQEEVEELLAKAEAETEKRSFTSDEVDSILEKVKAKIKDKPKEDPVEKLRKILTFDHTDGNDLYHPLDYGNYIIPYSQRKELQWIYEDMADRLTKKFTAFFRNKVEVELISVDILGFYELVMSISYPSTVQLFTLPPLGGFGIFEMSERAFLNFMALKRGALPDPPEEKREVLSDGDVKEFRKFTKICLRELCVAHRSFGKHGYSLDKFISDPRRIKPPAETPVLLVSFELRAEKMSGLMAFCFTYEMIKSFRAKLPQGTYEKDIADMFDGGCPKCCKIIDLLRDILKPDDRIAQKKEDI